MYAHPHEPSKDAGEVHARDISNRLVTADGGHRAEVTVLKALEGLPLFLTDEVQGEVLALLNSSLCHLWVAIWVGVGAHQGDITDGEDIVDPTIFHLVEVIDHQTVARAIAALRHTLDATAGDTAHPDDSLGLKGAPIAQLNLMVVVVRHNSVELNADSHLLQVL